MKQHARTCGAHFHESELIDLDSRRANLIRNLREDGIDDERVLEAIEKVPREIFVPPEHVERAYDNTALPIARGQTISQPLIVASMTQHLRLLPDMRVLEIGTGSGYQAAVLALLCRRVYTIERHDYLLRQAKNRFARLEFNNIATRLGDGSLGWPEHAPFDRVIVTAAAAEVPPALMDQLVLGGVMVLPIDGRFWHQELVALERTSGGYRTKYLMDVRFVPLVLGECEARQ